MEMINKQNKIINILLIVLLVNCKIIASASVTKEVGKHEKTVTTESSDILKKDAKSTTEGPVSNKDVEMETDSLTLDDFDRNLMDIFVVSLVPKPTSAPKMSDDFSSVEIESKDGDKKIGLGRRTNFRTRLNCRCIIHNRCARTESCLKEPQRRFF